MNCFSADDDVGGNQGDLSDDDRLIEDYLDEDDDLDAKGIASTLQDAIIIMLEDVR